VPDPQLLEVPDRFRVDRRALLRVDHRQRECPRPVDATLPALGAQRDPGVVQRGAAADQQHVPVGVLGG
jgi:hypothetical protein